jgi:hypothetical protein
MRWPLRKILVLLGAIIGGLVPKIVFAQSGPLGPPTAAPVLVATGPPKAGDLIANLVVSTGGFVEIFDYFAYTSGLLLCLISIFKFKDHVDNPANTPLSAGVKRFIAGGMFLSLPFMENVVQATMFDGNIGSNFSSTGTIDTSAGAVTPGGLDEMVVNFMDDIAGPFEMLLSAFAYFMATGLLVLGISRLTKRLDDGPRGPAGIGTIMTFITSGVLFAWGDVAGTFTNTIFDPTTGGQSVTAACVDPGQLLGLGDCSNIGTDAYKLSNVISAVLVFVAIVGMVAFVRGWLVLRAFADGQQGATLAQGLTFLIGGSLAINLGGLVNALEQTLGITNGITFT